MSSFIADPFFIVFIGMLVVVGGIIGLRLHAFIALVIAAFVVALLTPISAIKQYALASGMSSEEAIALANTGIGARIAQAFGNNAAEIGILIAMAAIIGKCLQESGAAERIIRAILRVTGRDKSPIAFLGSSFFIAIPVFFDTVFYLMIPLAKAMAARIGKNYLLLVLAIAGGAAMAHSLVPPTPGPLYLASVMHIPLYMMMIGGLIVGLFTISTGYLYALWANRTWPVPLRDSLDAPLEEMESLTKKDTAQLPALWLSVLPILIPLVFIGISGILKASLSLNTASVGISALITVVTFIGEKNTALVVGGLVALLILAQNKKKNREAIGTSMQEALMSGGVIILITAAGGAFGAMLQQTGISTEITELTAGYQMALIPLAFFITAVVRTAQGSATVSMITAAGILSGMVANENLTFNVLYLGLAIACGSKVFGWMNDSGFWVVCELSNLTEQETLKTFSVMLAIMGVTGFFVVFIAAWVFPLV